MKEKLKLQKVLIEYDFSNPVFSEYKFKATKQFSLIKVKLVELKSHESIYKFVQQIVVGWKLKKALSCHSQFFHSY